MKVASPEQDLFGGMLELPLITHIFRLATLDGVLARHIKIDLSDFNVHVPNWMNLRLRGFRACDPGVLFLFNIHDCEYA